MLKLFDLLIWPWNLNSQNMSITGVLLSEWNAFVLYIVKGVNGKKSSVKKYSCSDDSDDNKATCP